MEENQTKLNKRKAMESTIYRILQGPYDSTMRLVLTSLQRNIVPDVIIRRLIRMLLASRLRHGYKPSCQLQLSQLLQFVRSLKEMPILLNTDQPTSDPYELPPSFFKLVLGKNLKFSCCLFKDKTTTLEDAEIAMLELYCERAQIKDGQTVLDIGCGWGSLCLFIAQKYKNCRVTGITDSTLQKTSIDEQCRDLKLKNVDIIAADVSTLEMEAYYDRIFSIGTFEHMKNYKDLLKKISGWMEQDGLLFVDHICHKIFAYHMERVIEDDWISKYDWLTKNFFDGGCTVLSAGLLLYFQDDVSVVDHWLVNGKHFAQTSEEWLKRMDQNISFIKPIMETTYDKDSAVKWTVNWRTFFIYNTELFGYNNGEEWMISHILFKKK
ncbi:(S)-coclaurine N-methyltransferase-like isoform X1 [Ziziphus jujuba]|uniref:(S)-coclaurine N-methyltransferase-like isoform X1 n=2 Tax=Ziziphus jujuba TaxID=326968 RepID=A0A6P3ZVU8_ZIZJJ|nr:(S)-coclaurine N-methyltransferase-like isoform X1 [Ziziphus jujuba]